jgi:hypothetical protein
MARRKGNILKILLLLGWGASVGAFGVGLVNAVRDAAGPNRLMVPFAVETGASAQVFYDRGFGLRAEDCATAAVAAGTSLREVVFPVPRVALREVRFDPTTSTGTFRVGAPRLESASGRVIARFPLTAVVPRHQIASLTREENHWLGKTEAGANDAQLTFGLGRPLRVDTPRWPWPEGLAVLLLSGLGWRFREAVFDGGRRAVRGMRGRWEKLRLRNWAEVHPVAVVMIGAGFVLAVELFRLWPLHRTIDWPLWDEVNYAAAGRHWAEHGGLLGPFHNSPAIVLSYAALSWLGSLATAIFAQHYLVKLGTVVLLYVVLARWWRSAVAAAAVALWWGGTQFQLEFPLLVYQGAWLWFLAALAMVDRWPALGLGLVAVATGARQEYQFAALLLIGWLTWRAWRDGWSARRWLGRTDREIVPAGIATGLVVAGLVVVAVHSSWSGTDGRAWFAFRQHYALQQVSTGERKGINPWIDYDQVVQADFPGAASFGEALRINAAAMRRYVGWNLRNALPELAALGRPHPRIEGWGWLLAGLLALVTVGRRHRADARNGGPPASAVLAIGGVAAILPGLIVMAKSAYLIPALPAVLGGLGWIVGRLRGDRFLAAGRGCGVVGGVLLAIALAREVSGPRVFVPGERPRPVAQTAGWLIGHWPETGREKLLAVGASSYAPYIGEERCEGVEVFASVSGLAQQNESLSKKIDRLKPRAILVTAYWRQSAGYDEAALSALEHRPEWTVRELPDGRLYWREPAE